MGRVIAISNLKGGIGKTTTVINVGAGLALKGARVLLVDVDAQGNLAMALGLQPRRTLYEVLVEGAKASACLTPARPNLDLLAADQTLLGAQPMIAQRADWSRVLEQALRPLVDSYDFIFIDSGGSLTPLNINALVCANAVIAPTAIDYFSLKSVALLFEQVARIKGNSSSIRMIVPTKYDPRVRQSEELLAELRARYGQLVTLPVRMNVRLAEAPRLGRTIYEHDPRSRGAVDYALLVEQISAVFGFQPAPADWQAPPIGPQPETAVETQNGSTPAPAASVPVAPAASDQPQFQAHKIQSFTAPVCPYCGRPLQSTNLAGYRVDYCDHCQYKSQTLAREPRR